MKQSSRYTDWYSCNPARVGVYELRSPPWLGYRLFAYWNGHYFTDAGVSIRFAQLTMSAPRAAHQRRVVWRGLRRREVNLARADWDVL